jgi:hypothetical protein
MLRLTFRAGALAVLAAPLFATDTFGAGWGADSFRAFPTHSAFAIHDTLANGDRVVFDGSLAWVEQDDGTVLFTIGATPVPSFGSFVEIGPGEAYVLLGESSNGVIFKAPIASMAGLAPLATLPFNYDLAYAPDGASAFVSAATCGFGCGNELYRVDVVTGATTLVAIVGGPSGPLAVSGAGDLYYATQSDTFPTPPGSVDVIRWTAAQIANGPLPLLEGQAAVFRGGLDGSSSLAFDPQFGHLYVGESVFGSTSRVLEIDRAGAIVGEVATSLDTLGKVEVVDVAGAGVLAAFQPAGAQLLYRTTDFNNGTSQVVRVSPRRPQLTALQNGNGTMTITLAGMTPGTVGFVVSSPASLYNPVESAFDLGTYLFWTGMPYPNNIRRVGNQITADVNGQGSFTFSNPGPIQGTRVIQVLVRDGQGTFRGTSNAITN